MELKVKTSSPYRIVIEPGCLSSIGAEARGLFQERGKAMIISDSNVFPLYGGAVKASLEAAGFEPYSFVFPAGEASKQLCVIQEMYAALAEHRFTRTDFIVALGGGVTGDMAGFAAATFLRGMGFLQIPTSLLAQIDSSVGGKTGVDLPQGKNLVGAFHQPRLVLIDPHTLVTLPPRYFADGMGEAVKYGCIKSRPLFDMIRSCDMKNNPDILADMIYQCVDCKRQVVEKDEFDTRERMLLNFGHTLGHALEKLHHFSGLSHGEAVGVGMVWIARAGEKHGLTKPGTAKEIAGALSQYGLPVSDPAPLSSVTEATAMDKKGAGGSLNLILLKEIGHSFLYPVDRDTINSFLEGCSHG